MVVNGQLPANVLPKDLILYLIGQLTAEGANFKVIEFHGETIANMTTSGRLTICNMAVEAGATSGIVPPDAETLRYLKEVAGVGEQVPIFGPDPDAVYERVLEIDAAALSPQVACPHTVDNVKPVEAVSGKAIQQIVIGSCTNGRLDDIEIAARILKGKKIARGVRMLIFPASARIFREAMKAGYLSILMEAGAVVANSGCGPCLGVHQGALGDGEVSAIYHQPQFQGPHGQPESRSLPVFSGSGSRQRPDRCDYRSP